jgi:hypothetical protein
MSGPASSRLRPFLIDAFSLAEGLPLEDSPPTLGCLRPGDATSHQQRRLQPKRYLLNLLLVLNAS